MTRHIWQLKQLILKFLYVTNLCKTLLSDARRSRFYVLSVPKAELNLATSTTLQLNGCHEVRVLRNKFSVHFDWDPDTNLYFMAI